MLDKKSLDYYEAQIDIAEDILRILYDCIEKTSPYRFRYKTAVYTIRDYALGKKIEGYNAQEEILADMAEQAGE